MFFLFSGFGGAVTNRITGNIIMEGLIALQPSFLKLVSSSARPCRTLRHSFTTDLHLVSKLTEALLPFRCLFRRLSLFLKPFERYCPYVNFSPIRGKRL